MGMNMRYAPIYKLTTVDNAYDDLVSNYPHHSYIAPSVYDANEPMMTIDDIKRAKSILDIQYTLSKYNLCGTKLIDMIKSFQYVIHDKMEVIDSFGSYVFHMDISLCDKTEIGFGFIISDSNEENEEPINVSAHQIFDDCDLFQSGFDAQCFYPVESSSDKDSVEESAQENLNIETVSNIEELNEDSNIESVILPLMSIPFNKLYYISSIYPEEVIEGIIKYMHMCILNGGSIPSQLISI